MTPEQWARVLMAGRETARKSELTTTSLLLGSVLGSMAVEAEQIAREERRNGTAAIEKNGTTP